MMAKWTRWLPYAVVVWAIKRHCERVNLAPANYYAANPYPGEILSWKPPSQTERNEG